MATYRINQVIESRGCLGYITKIEESSVTVFFYDSKKETRLMLAFAPISITEKPDHVELIKEFKANKKEWVPSAAYMERRNNPVKKEKLADIIGRCQMADGTYDKKYNAVTKSFK